MSARKVTTRKAQGQPQVETYVTLDFTGVTEAEKEELAASGIIITEQAVWRNGEIPKGAYTIKVREQLDRPKGSGGFKPMTPETVMAKALADPAFMAALKEQLKKK